jgi:hypothetical protein
LQRNKPDDRRGRRLLAGHIQDIPGRPGCCRGCRQIGGAFVIAIAVGLVGLLCYWYCRVRDPSFFQGETLSRATPTLVPDE